jgi:NAD(P)-dependent dehydrogenase (short-subunit alcohol dehydrogenase family)
MSTAPTVTSIQREPELLGQIVVVIGGSAGIGLETARRARAEGAEVVVTGRDPGRLEHAARELGALSSSAFDAADPDRLAVLPGPADPDRPRHGHRRPPVLRAPGRHRPRASPPRGRRASQAHAPRGPRGDRQGTARRHAAVHDRHRRPASRRWRADRLGTHRGVARAYGQSGARAGAGAHRPHRRGFVDTPLSALLLGDQLDERRNQLRATLPIGRLVGPADVAALAVHLMTNTALTGATYDIDGGQQLV